MDKNELIEALSRFPYDRREYWVVAGGAMVLYGIKEETQDIDLGCSCKLADLLEKDGHLTGRTEDGNRRFRYSDSIEVFENWLEGSIVDIAGIQAVSLDGLLEMKKKLGREKDLKDIELIKSYMSYKEDEQKVNYRVVDKESYYRTGVYRHFTEDCKCSVSMTARIDVTDLVQKSKETDTKFYVNFLYLLSKVLNSRDDYKMGYLWETDELICYDVINPTQYVFYEDTQTCTPVYTEYVEEYDAFYKEALKDIDEAKKKPGYRLSQEDHPNWFDASYIPWCSYDSMNIELPDGYLYFAPIVNWGKYREENGKLMMPVSVRLNHAVADGYLVAKVFSLLQGEIDSFVKE